ncbi:MAG: inosine/xanthosine triphosphatase [Candidatus Methanomethylophilaceae archaeon]|nr:inosine/xanthosine triphosphatase [Candidatus Methanomethylophilaceae archaeon]
MTRTVAVAGTFNVLHDGHRELLRRAFSEGDEVLIGMTSDSMARGSRSTVLSMALRRRELEAFVGGLGRYEVFEIDDVYGPRDVMDRADALIVSEETLGNGMEVSRERTARGLPPLDIVTVPLVRAHDGTKISASAILRGDYGRHGRADVPRIAVGSANQVKVSAVRTVMERIYGEVRIYARDVDSGVPPQPFGEQTRRGSYNRAMAALGDCDLSVGIEAGVFEMEGGLYDIQHCTVVSDDGVATHGQGSGFRYPDRVAELVRNGMTVGDAMHAVYGDTDIGKKQGAIGLLSKGLLDRKGLTEQSVTAAMIPRIWDE